MPNSVLTPSLQGTVPFPDRISDLVPQTEYDPSAQYLFRRKPQDRVAYQALNRIRHLIQVPDLPRFLDNLPRPGHAFFLVRPQGHFDRALVAEAPCQREV